MAALAVSFLTSTGLAGGSINLETEKKRSTWSRDIATRFGPDWTIEATASAIECVREWSMTTSLSIFFISAAMSRSMRLIVPAMAASTSRALNWLTLEALSFSMETKMSRDISSAVLNKSLLSPMDSEMLFLT